jgi:3-phosphoshikimate 1-carboxyvinyltransferase
LGTEIESQPGYLLVNVRGWGEAKNVDVKSDVSSQYASAILLNCWNLKQEFTINLGDKVVSESFLDLTKNVCRELGMSFGENRNSITIAPKQQVQTTKACAEVDAFGELHVSSYQNKYGQPDFQFLDFFSQWGLAYSLGSDGFKIAKQKLNRSLDINIQNCPDLFPVLCAWLSFNPGTHKVYGAPHLVNKESDRIGKTFELLSLAGIRAEKRDDGMIVYGIDQPKPNSFQFDPDHDHRMAFAAALFGYAGFKVSLLEKDVVNKSFPNFWNVLGLIDESH